MISGIYSQIDPSFALIEVTLNFEAAPDAGHGGANNGRLWERMSFAKG